MSVKVFCPQCGAEYEIDGLRESIFCSECGAKILNPACRPQEIKSTYASNNFGGNIASEGNRPNLYINYGTVNNNVKMVVRIVDTGQINYYLNGQTLSYHLMPGMHTVVLKIGNKNYSRTVCIPSNSSAVKIYAAWNGRAQINIDQPDYIPEITRYSMDANTQQSLVAAIKKPQSAKSIISFICAMTFYGSVLGLILGIIDLAVNQKDKAHGLAKAGLIISSIEIFLFIVVNLLSSQSF